MEARNITVGTKYKSGNTIQEVVEICKITDKTIEFRTKRIYPDIFVGNFYQRKRLGSILQVVN